MRVKRFGFYAAILLLATAGCGDDTQSPSTTTTVNMTATAFSPSAVTIALGNSVRWLNPSGIAHNITPNNPAQPGAWSAITVPATTGFAVEQRFNTAGTFAYSCTIHAGMTGSVTVQ